MVLSYTKLLKVNQSEKKQRETPSKRFLSDENSFGAFLTLYPTTKKLYLSKFKAIAHDKLNLAYIMNGFSVR